MLRLVLPLLIAASVAVPASAQQSRRKAPAKPAAQQPAAKANTVQRKLHAIRWEGLEHYTPKQATAVLGLKPGAVIPNPDAFAHAQQRLLATGAFGSVSYQYEPAPNGLDWDLTLEVKEIEQIFPYRFEDLQVPDEELAAHLAAADPLFGKEVSGTKENLERVAREIEKFLAAKGVPEKVVGKVVAERPEELMVLFRPDRPYPSVAEIHFLGTEVYPAEILQRRFFNVGVGSQFTERRFRELLRANILPMYEEKGHLAVKFTDIQTEPAEDVKGLVVKVTVDEGPVYELTSFRVTGPNLPEEELVKAAKIPVEEPANFEVVKEGTERMKELLRQNGYLKPTTEVTRNVNDEEKKVSLVIRVDPGDQYRFRRLKIQGLDILGESAIKKMWTMKPGDRFSSVYPDFFLNEVRSRHMFDNLEETRAVVNTDDEAREVDVTLIFR